jgi:hypothetical protein
MALASASGHEFEEVLYLGHSVPHDYKGGEFNGQPFPAGTSMLIYVGTGDVIVHELKVKGKEYEAVNAVLRNCGRGMGLLLEYGDGQTSKQKRCFGVELIDEAARKSVA